MLYSFQLHQMPASMLRQEVDIMIHVYFSQSVYTHHGFIQDPFAVLQAVKVPSSSWGHASSDLLPPFTS